MSFKAFFYNKKGGQGKTTWAVGYALYSNSMYITNDIDNGTKEVYGELFQKGQYHEFSMQSDSDAIPSPKGDISVVYDFGGYSSRAVEQVIQVVDVAVVVIQYQSKADLIPTFNVINEFKKHCKNIVVLINNTDPKRSVILKSHITTLYTDIKVFEIMPSEYVRRLADEGLPISELMNSGGVVKYQVGLKLKPQVTAFYDYLEELKSSKK